MSPLFRGTPAGSLDGRERGGFAMPRVQSGRRFSVGLLALAGLGLVSAGIIATYRGRSLDASPPPPAASTPAAPSPASAPTVTLSEAKLKAAGLRIESVR